METVLSKAFADTERSYCAAKATVGQLSSSLLASGPAGIPVQRTDLSRASEQLRHFTGWVYAAVRPIAQRIAGQPIRVGKVRKPKGTKAATDAEPLDSHPLLDLLADPNDLMVSWSLIYSTVASLELTGRCLWWLPEGRQIYPIPTSWLTGFEGATSFIAFLVRPPNSTEALKLPAEECCYFAYPDPADPHGSLSPLSAVGGAVDADEAMTSSQISMFRRGIHPSHAILVGKQPVEGVPGGMRPRLSDAQSRQIIGAILKRYAGVHRHGEPVILDGMIEDVKTLSHSPAEMDWLNSGKVTKARIMQGFGTNPIIAGEVEGANRASATAADKHFVDFTVNPKIELLSQCLTEWLGSMFDDDLIIWIEPAVANDAEMELSRMTLAANSGVVGYNELRRFAGLPEQEEKGQRNSLLSTVGGMTGAVQILSAVGQGVMAPDSAAQLLALFFEIPDAQARKIVGSGEGSRADRQLAAQLGTLRANELRRAAGLPPDPDLDHVIVGKGTTGSPSPLDSVIREAVMGVLGELQAGSVLSQL